MVSPDDSNNEKKASEVLKPLRSIEAPIGTREKSLAAMLSTGNEKAIRKRQDGIPWWRRTVSVPAPILAATVILVVWLGSHALWSPRGEEPPLKNPGRSTVERSGGVTTPETKGKTESLAFIEYEKRFSVAGIGDLEVRKGNRLE